MESQVVPKLCALKRFRHWTVCPSKNRPGSCDILPIREIASERDLNAEERAELKEIIDQVVHMFEGALGECDSYSRWDGNTYNVRALKKDRTELSEQTALELFECLLQAAAAFAA